jgi:hypothetical protein
MRKYNKFKPINKFYIYPYFFQNRIFRFKRPKWLGIQKKILIIEKQIQDLKSLAQLKKKNLKYNTNKIKVDKKNKVILLKNLFFNFISIKSKIHSWQRLRFFQKENLWSKNIVRKYFDGCFSISYFKRLFKKTRTRCFTISSIFIRPEFRLDVLLWRLKIFSSVFLSKYAIRNQKIMVNGLITSFNFYLKKGDIIDFSLEDGYYNLKRHFLKYLKIVFIPSFVEVDFYTNTIIILKSYNDFKISEFSSIIKEPLDIQKFKNYILK